MLMTLVTILRDFQMTTLIYIPTGLASPELEILLAKAQSSIDSGEETVIATCSGGQGYACSLNIFGSKLICGVCKSLTKRSISYLRGDFVHIVTPLKTLKVSSNSQRRDALHNRWKIKSYVLDNVDIGQAAYSSYIGLSRDQDLEGLLAGWSQNCLLATSETLLFWFSEQLSRKNVNNVVLYNGRHNQYRPLLRVAQKLNITVEVMEFSGQDASCVYIFNNELPQEIEVLNRYIEAHWKNFHGDINKSVDLYYSRKRAGGVINDVRSYVLGQKTGMLPKNWNPKIHNVVIFNSSEDEYSAVGGEYDKTLYPNQTNAITRICESLSDDKNIRVWLRIHPNLKNVRWSFAQKLLGLEKLHNNVSVIKADSPVSSYALLDACNVALSFGSTMGIEAAYAGKPSILVGRCVYERLGSVYTPKTHDEVVELLKERNLPALSTEGALKVALFWISGGIPIKYLEGDRRSGFRFNGHYIHKTIFESIIYNFAKIIEKYFIGDVLNSFFRRFKKVQRFI
jgi:hypothetical protein